jgi:hypothetical protein
MIKQKRTFRYWLQFFILFILISSVFGLLYLYTISNQHLYNISNYAIAIALGFSSVCFSWSKAEDIEEFRHSLLSAGQNFMFSTIVLIIASLFDYASYNVSNSTSMTLKQIASVLKLGYFMFFCLGTIVFLYGAWQILNVIEKKR